MGKSVDFEPSGDGDFHDDAKSIAHHYFSRRIGSLWYPKKDYVGTKIHGFKVEDNGWHIPGAFRLDADMTWVLINCFTSISMTELTFIVNESTKACIRISPGDLSKWIFKMNECKSNER